SGATDVLATTRTVGTRRSYPTRSGSGVGGWTDRAAWTKALRPVTARTDPAVLETLPALGVVDYFDRFSGAADTPLPLLTGADHERPCMERAGIVKPTAPHRCCPGEGKGTVGGDFCNGMRKRAFECLDGDRGVVNVAGPLRRRGHEGLP